LTAPLARRVTSTPERHQFYPVRVADGAVHPAFKSSGDITSMAGADGYIEIPAGVAVLEEGASVLVKLF
jgi:putative molybdopterin biosynthesis protein